MRQSGRYNQQVMYLVNRRLYVSIVMINKTELTSVSIDIFVAAQHKHRYIPVKDCERVGDFEASCFFNFHPLSK